MTSNLQRQTDTPVAEFLINIACLNNGAMTEIGEFAAAQGPRFRAQVIERLSAMIGAIASETGA